MRNLGWLVIGAVLIAMTAIADDWPQWRGLNRDGVWHETGVVERFAGPRLEHVWRAEISNGYSGPTVVDGRVYVTDRLVEPEQLERVLCFSEATGEPLWQDVYPAEYRVGYPDGPRASVTIAGGRAYAIGTMGHLRCYDAATGKLLWKKDPGADYDLKMPTWGITAAPLVEGGLVIVMVGAKPDGCLIAYTAETGEERWRALGDDPASYSAPIVIEQGARRILVCWSGRRIAGLEPETGKLLWELETPQSRGVINVPTPVVEGDRMFLSSFYDGAYMLRLLPDAAGVETIWRRSGPNERRTEALHNMNSTSIILGDFVYGADSYGQFRCLDGNTGERVWEDLTLVPENRWATIHMVRNGNRIWMFNDQGELIITELSKAGVREISRTLLIEPTEGQYSGSFSRVQRGSEDGGGFTRTQGVVWSHPAFANKRVYIRNDAVLVCADLTAR